MKTAALHGANLVHLQFNEKEPLIQELDVYTGKEVLKQNTGPNGSLCFVVRRPGWPLVRADARILQSKVDELHGLKIFAIVKETGIDDAGLHEFHREYFKYPTYKDHERVFYNALGSGTISFGFNPLGIIKLIQDSFKRMKELGVQSYNMKGEGTIQGGWILFDKNGVPQSAFQEDAKQRIPIDDILSESKKMQGDEVK